ncbi:hypothetical protein Plhal703r1_c38g0135571 [Plasmopara halstedii]
MCILIAPPSVKMSQRKCCKLMSFAQPRPGLTHTYSAKFRLPSPGSTMRLSTILFITAITISSALQLPPNTMSEQGAQKIEPAINKHLSDTSSFNEFELPRAL